MDVDYIVEGIIMSGQNYNVRKGRYNSCVLRNYNVVISMDVYYIVEGIIMSGRNYNVRKGHYNSCVILSKEL